MTFEEYQKEAVKFRTDTADNEEYLTLGLIEEVGEAAGKLAGLEAEEEELARELSRRELEGKEKKAGLIP